MTIRLEFDSDKGYGSGFRTKSITKEDYLSLPVLKWCHEKLGPINFPKDPNEVLTGDGWEIYADWEGYLKGIDKPRIYVIIDKQINQRLITEFWMKFSQ